MKVAQCLTHKDNIPCINTNINIEATFEDLALTAKVGTKATIIGGKVVWKVGTIGGWQDD